MAMRVITARRCSSRRSTSLNDSSQIRTIGSIGPSLSDSSDFYHSMASHSEKRRSSLRVPTPGSETKNILTTYFILLLLLISLYFLYSGIF